MKVIHQVVLLVGILQPSQVSGFVPSSSSSSLSSSSSTHGVTMNMAMSEEEQFSSRRSFFGTSAAAAAVLVVSATTPTPSFAAATEDAAVVAADDAAMMIALRVGGKLTYGDESIMSNKEHGTTSASVQESLRFGVNRKVADRISSYNRHFAEYGGYFRETSFENVVLSQAAKNEPVTFYDSVSGKPLFRAPIGRSTEDFLTESAIHGWPSFRDQEVVWENVRVLKGSGETVSLVGTHLGHNLPDRNGNRYCINLVSVAGSPIA